MLFGSSAYRTLNRCLLFLLCCLLLIPVPGASGQRHVARLQPQLADLAQSTPTAIVPVIVQLDQVHAQLQSQITALGGTITKELQIINAVVVEVPAQQLPHLAQVDGVRWISLDAPVVTTSCDDCISAGGLQTLYNQAIGADQLWNEPSNLRGEGIGIAVLDSGIQANHPDLAGRVAAGVSTLFYYNAKDYYGHGTYVAGLIGGDGATSDGGYIGVAPESDLIDVKVTTFTGASTESDVIAGLQWVYENREVHNIRIVNLSLNASEEQSYHTSPLSAACEVLWFNGIIVVTSAGNYGEGTIYPPANDPFVITVGATDDMGTATIADDKIAPFSAYGTTVDGIAKPDLVAPGRRIVGPLATNMALLTLFYPNRAVGRSHMRMSGTSAAAPMVSGAIALLLQQEPDLTPDQVKYRLQHTANRSWDGYNAIYAGAGYLDIAAAVRGDTTESANTGLAISKLLTTGPDGIGQLVGSFSNLNWDSVSWSSISWSSVSWSSVSWSSISWSSDYIEEDDEIFLPFYNFFREREDTFDAASLDELSLEDIMEVALPHRLYLPIVSGGE